jgi:uncharacterized protein
VRASLFNVTVPLPGTDDVFLMNTFTDAQVRVSRDVVDLLDAIDAAPVDVAMLSPEDQQAIDTLAAHGFLVEGHEQERAAVRASFEAFREDASQLRVTLLTTLQCNFACGYCVQGEHGQPSATPRMSLDTAAATLAWIEERLDTLRPASFVLTFFGGEPLLNMPVVELVAERAWHACKARGVAMLINVITNGVLLTPDVVDRLLPFGLNGVKITLDGDRETHDQMRPLRGGQGTFDRIIANIGHVAGRCRVAIGGNFDAASFPRFEPLLDFLAAQDFAPLLDKVVFKPLIGKPRARAAGGVIPLTPVGADASSTSCRPSGTRLGGSPCDTCHFVDDQMSALREATRARGFRTLDGVHMGPCELHRRHAYTVGPNGELYACPGFTGDPSFSVGYIDGRRDGRLAETAARFSGMSPWRDACGDCAFVPVCGGGCSVAAQAEHGDLRAPSCRKRSFESAVNALARDVA